MTIRVRVTNGVLVPLDPLPAAWHEGDQFPIERNGVDGKMEESSDDENWMALEQAVSEVTDDDFQRGMEALARHRAEAKEWMRSRMESR